MVLLSSMFIKYKWILSFNEKDDRNTDVTEPDEMESLK